MKLKSLGISLVVFGVTGLAASGGDFLERVLKHALDDPEGIASHTFDHSFYEMDGESRKHLPIGVFDSGIGGLTVLEAILGLDAFHNETLQPGADGVPDFVEERFVYLGDQANMPYGRYPAVGGTDFLRELILKDALFLLGTRWRENSGAAPRHDKPPVKAIVIACNTATAYGLADLREAVDQWNIPVFVIGVVEAGARGVLESRRGEADRPHGAIAVMATVGTCDSGVYPNQIRTVLGRAGHLPGDIIQQGSSGLAAVIEGNPAYPLSVAGQAMKDVRELVEGHRATGAATPVETIVLGCTHYPLALNEIESAFEQVRKESPDLAAAVAGTRIYVDPAEWAARELFRELAGNRLRLKHGERKEDREHLFFLSVPHPASPLSEDGNALDTEYQYSRKVGRLDTEDTVVVPLDSGKLPENVARMLEQRLPHVWHALGK